MSIKPMVSRPGNVQELLAEGPRSWERACELMAQVAGEVADGHARGLTHLSLTPAAIVLDETGAYDGILERTEIVSSATTLHYTAPEILVDAAPDERCDVYSMGAILLALLSGRHPFRAQNSTAQATIARILHDVPDLEIPGVPTALQMLLENSLRKNPEHRTVTAAEFARVTRKLAAGASVTRVVDQPVPESTPAVAAVGAAPGDSGSGINWIAGGLAVALFFGVIFAGAVAAKLADGDDISIDLVRSDVRPVPDAGGEGATTSVVIEPVAAAPRVAESAPAEPEPATGDDGATADVTEAGDDDASASAAFVSALATARTETSEVIGSATEDEPEVDDAPAVEVLGEQETEAEPLEIVPIIKSAWDEYELELGDRLDVNVLDNDSLSGRTATVALAPDELLPSGFLLTPNGRLAGIAQVCGVTETGYQLTTEDGITSTSILRMVVRGCDEGA
jgi:hypothetical protein